MARTCTICSNSARQAIDTAIVASGVPATIATQYHVVDESLRRHRDSHMPKLLVKAAEAKEVARADDLLSQVRYLQSKALGILGKAEDAGDLKVAMGAIREARGKLELLVKLVGQLSDAPQVNVLVMPEWLSMRSAILAALAPYGEAKAAVATRLVELESAG